MKNFFLTEERTMPPQAREAMMAMAAERRYAKADILEALPERDLPGPARRPRHLRDLPRRRSSTSGKRASRPHGRRDGAAGGHDPRAERLLAVPQRRRARWRVATRCWPCCPPTARSPPKRHEAARAEPLARVPLVPALHGPRTSSTSSAASCRRRFPPEILTSEGYSIFTTPRLRACRRSPKRAVKRGSRRRSNAAIRGSSARTRRSASKPR